MKLSIWQQFSSNHSSHFIVIGRFEDVDTATAKADQLRDWLYRMLWGQDYENAKEELLAAYPVEWYEDGLWWNGWPDNVDHIVRQFNTDVFLMCPVETWDSHQPFVDLLRKMGPFNTIDSRSVDSYSANMSVDITCIAPTRLAANRIFDVVKRLSDRLEAPMPWAIYSPEFPEDSELLTTSNYDQHEKQWVHDAMEWHKFFRVNYFDSDGNSLPTSQTKHLEHRLDQFYTQDRNLRSQIYAIRDKVNVFRGEARLDGEKIFVEGIRSFRLDIFLIAFVKWLESFGCEVSYEFVKRDTP